MGLGQCWQILVESSGVQFWVPFSQRAQFGVSVTSAWLGLPQLSALHPKVLQVPFGLLKIPPSHPNLDERGRKKQGAGGAPAPGMLFSSQGSCAWPQVGFALQPGPRASFCRGFQSPGSPGTQMCCCAWTAAWAWEMFWKEKWFCVFCTIGRPKEKQGWSSSSKGRVFRNDSKSQWFLQQKNF